MKKYNLSNIMKRAWALVKELKITISCGLRRAWKEAKNMGKAIFGVDNRFGGLQLATLETNYIGTPEEIAEADQIVAYLYDRALAKRDKLTVIMAMDDSRRELSATKSWIEAIKAEGFEDTTVGASEFFLAHTKWIQVIKAAKTAKEIIAEYGAAYTDAKNKGKKPYFAVTITR